MARSKYMIAVLLLCVVLSTPRSSSAEKQSLVEDIESVSEVFSFSQRHLLQTKQQCPIDFASMNYTSITSVCNNTNPDKTLCCTSFVNFACPYADYINDDKTNCATNLFSYLNMAGNYQAALFSSLCQGDATGLPCPVAPSPAPALPSSAFTHTPWRYAIILINLFSLMAIIF